MRVHSSHADHRTRLIPAVSTVPDAPATEVPNARISASVVSSPVTDTSPTQGYPPHPEDFVASQ